MGLTVTSYELDPFGRGMTLLLRFDGINWEINDIPRPANANISGLRTRSGC